MDRAGISAETAGPRGVVRDFEVPKTKSDEHAVAAKIPRNQSGAIEMNAIGGRVKVHLRASLDPRSRVLTSPSVLDAGDPQKPCSPCPVWPGPTSES